MVYYKMHNKGNIASVKDGGAVKRLAYYCIWNTLSSTYRRRGTCVPPIHHSNTPTAMEDAGACQLSAVSLNLSSPLCFLSGFVITQHILILHPSGSSCHDLNDLHD